jgi:hypothetical protein
LGISPMVRMVLMSSTKDYSDIWLSENINTAELLSLKAHSCDHSFIFSRNYFNLKFLEMVT